MTSQPGRLRSTYICYVLMQKRDIYLNTGPFLTCSFLLLWCTILPIRSATKKFGKIRFKRGTHLWQLLFQVPHWRARQTKKNFHRLALTTSFPAPLFAGWQLAALRQGFAVPHEVQVNVIAIGTAAAWEVPTAVLAFPLWRHFRRKKLHHACNSVVDSFAMASLLHLLMNCEYRSIFKDCTLNTPPISPY
jgi:hypothetical protein